MVEDFIVNCFAIIGVIASLVGLTFVVSAIRDHLKAHGNKADRQKLLQQKHKWATVPIEER